MRMYGRNTYDNPGLPRTGGLLGLMLVAAAMGGSLRIAEPDNAPIQTEEPEEKIPGYADRMRQLDAEERRARREAKRLENQRRTEEGKERARLAACRAAYNPVQRRENNL